MNCKYCLHWETCFGQEEICNEFKSKEEWLKEKGVRSLEEIENELNEMFK